MKLKVKQDKEGEDEQTQWVAPEGSRASTPCVEGVNPTAPASKNSRPQSYMNSCLERTGCVSMRRMSQPQFDPVKGKAAFESLLPRYKMMSAELLVMVNADVGQAAVAALGVAARANEADLLTRFKKLPTDEFDASLVEQLATIAWACWHAFTEHQKVRALATDAKLPADLVQNAMTIESRMQACCEYYLNDDPVIGPYLAMLRAGTGHRDLAADLLGYAEVYRDHYDIVSVDKKYFRVTDADDAVKTAEAMLGLLGAKLGPETRISADDLARAWTLLFDTYDEVATTGRWLLRKDSQADKVFPSLHSMARVRHGGRGRKKAAAASIMSTPTEG